MPVNRRRLRRDSSTNSLEGRGGGRLGLANLAPATGAGSAAAVHEPVPFQFFEAGITPLRYPILYAMFIVAATLDIAFTWYILSIGGIEVNPVARVVIDAWALNGAIAFKYALTLFVIVLCEAVGRHRDAMGRLLAVAAVVISSLPVLWSSSLLLSLALWL